VRSTTHRPTDPKQHSLLILLVEALVPQQHSAVSIHVRPGVFDLADLAQDGGDHSLALGHEVNPFVALDVLGRELGLHREPGVCFAQHSVSLAWHHSS